MPHPCAVRSVEDMAHTLTSPTAARRGIPVLPALVLAILGNIFVIVFLAIAVLLFVAAGVAVFWPAIATLL